MIKKIVLNVLIIISIAALMRTKMYSVIGIYDVLPDIFLILTVMNGIFIDPIFGMIFGFAAGLTCDHFGTNAFGFYALIYTVVGYSTSLSKYVYVENLLISTLLMIVFFIIKTFVYLSLGFIFLDSGTINQYFKNQFLVEVLYTLVLSMPIFFLYKRIFANSRKK